MIFQLPKGFLAQHVIVLGKTRSGKSSKMRLLVERLLRENQPVCIIDPKGDWWGLKSSADGKHDGFPVVIFGGEHADVPINAQSGTAIAELVATGNRPSLIDLGGWRISDRTRFFIDFAEAFFKHSRGTRYLVIDEVHKFCPKGKVFSPQAGEMLHWANTLASEGQGKGIILIAASQRPQKVHNDFLTSCETLIACKVNHKADRDAIKDWIDGCADPLLGKQVLLELASMQRPEAWVWSPEIDFGPKRVEFPLFETFDSFKPRQEHAAKLKGWAEVDLEEVKSKLASVLEEATANDPALLKKRIAELERQVKQPAPPPPTVEPVDFAALQNEAYQGGYADGRDRGWKDCADRLRPDLTGLANLTEAVSGELLGMAKRMTDIGKIATSTPKFRDAPPTTPVFSVPKARTGVMRSTPEPAPAKANGHGEPVPTVPTGPRPNAWTVCQRILDALAELEQMGATEPPREMLAFMAGYSHVNSKGFANGMSPLRMQGLIEGGRLTAAGRAMAHPPPRPRTTAELQDRIINMLGGASARVLRPLLNAYPKGLERQALAEEAGYSHINSKGFAVAMARMRTLGFINTVSGAVFAQPLLFLEGA